MMDPVCIHEAAHAVIAHCLSVKVTGIFWNGKAGKDSKGGTHFDLKVRPRTFDPVVDCCITMAGHVAEVEWCKRDVTCWPKSDLLHIRARKITWRGNNILQPIVRKWLRQEKKAVFSVAECLSEKKNMTRRQFIAALRRSNV